MEPSKRSPPLIRNRSLAGIGLMVTGIALFSVNDALGKSLLASYSVGELMVVRGIVSLALLLPFLWRAGMAELRKVPRRGLQVLRMVLSVLDVAMFFWAVSYLPLADTVTFYLAGPIYVTAFSAILLHEKVGGRRWTAVLVGFTGVVLAFRPSAASLTLPALIAFVGSVAFAFLMIVTRHLRETSNLMLVAGQIVATFLFGVAAAPFGWVAPSRLDFALMALFGAISIIAVACVNHSLRLADASLVVPYQYTLIVWAIVLGYVVFGDVPDPFTISGALVIIASGIYIFWREHNGRDKDSTTPLHP